MSKLEIEMKFLVDRNKLRAFEDRFEGRRDIYQPYLLAAEGWEIRGRVSNYRQKMDGMPANIAEITIKSPPVTSLGRYEFDGVVGAAWLRSQPVINSIEKTRVNLKYEGFLWEIDFFHGANEGLVVAECEYTSDMDHTKIPVPPFCYIDVTDDARYSNKNLAETPWTKWKEE